MDLRVSFLLAIQDQNRRENLKASANLRHLNMTEYYCDPPITPEEHAEEKNVLYPPHRPFVDRIEECIQRFRARRRLDNRREHIFSQYLMLGGIDATVRQFQSSREITDETMEITGKSLVREMTADDVINRAGEGAYNHRFYNPRYPEHWDVDFSGIVAGFLYANLLCFSLDCRKDMLTAFNSSERFRAICGTDVGVLADAADVITNFLNYVDSHDVCPEYREDVRNARKVCKQAREELPAIWEAVSLLPGEFNTALSTLYCCDEEVGSSLGPSGLCTTNRKQAEIYKAATITIILGPDYAKGTGEWFVTDTVEQDFEICEIKSPSTAALANYKRLNDYFKERLADSVSEIKPCGTMVVQPVSVRDGWDNSASETVMLKGAGRSFFILEQDILDKLGVGMKLKMEVCTLNVGLKFIKSITDIRPTFYVFLPQELMFGYKDPAPNKRPAPSIHDDEADDDAGDNDD